MDRARFLKHFEVVASSPEQIPALRKLIFAHLVHAEIQSSDAEARAAELRKQYHPSTEKKKLSAATDPVTVADLPPDFSALPCSLFERLGKIASIEKGLSQIQKTEPGPYPLVVTAEARSSSKSYDFEGSAVIVPMVSSTGHGDASLKRIHYQEGKYAVGNILSVIRPIRPDLIGARFLYEYLSAFKEELLVSRMVGTANVSLTVNKLLEVPVPLISGPVVERIDGLMALCDELEARQTAAREQRTRLVQSAFDHLTAPATPADFRHHADFSLKEFSHLTATPDSIPALRQAILSLAVQGKLVPKVSTDEPVSSLVRRIEAERNTIKQAGEPRIPAEFETVSELEHAWNTPAHWEWRRLAELVLFIDYRGQTPKKTSNGVRLITAKNVRKGFLSIEPEEFIAEDAYDQWMTRGLPRTGDVLFTTEAPLGNACVLELEERVALAQRTINFRLFGGIDPHFVVQCICSPLYQQFLEEHATGMTATGIKAGKLKFLPFPLPPLAEQQRIVAKVAELMRWCDELEAQLITAETASAALLDSSLHALLAG